MQPRLSDGTFHKTHGKTGTKVYRAWQAIKTRCYNSKHSKLYKYHGAMGTKMYEGWHQNFMAFYEHIGDPPTQTHTIERIDPYGNYEPGNIKWATRKEQRHNHR